MPAVAIVLLLTLLAWRIGFRYSLLRETRELLNRPMPTESTGAANAEDGSREPAYRFPGVPAGWSLDAYARDGIKQMQIMLVQQVRRRGEN